MILHGGARMRDGHLLPLGHSEEAGGVGQEFQVHHVIYDDRVGIALVIPAFDSACDRGEAACEQLCGLPDHGEIQAVARFIIGVQNTGLHLEADVVLPVQCLDVQHFGCLFQG